MGEIGLDKLAFFSYTEALKTIKDKVSLIDKPFETIFGVIGPMIPSSNLWKIFLLLAEVIGYGPSNIGAFIDKLLGFGSGTTPDLSDQNLKGAASTTVNTLIGKFFNRFGSSSEAMLKDLYLIKKSLDVSDLVAIGLYVKSNNIKTAKSARVKGLRRFFSKAGRGGILDITNVLFAILKKFAMGLIGLGLVGGVVGGVKEYMKPGSPGVGGGGLESLFPKTREPEQLQMQPGSTDLYLNVKHNVEDTLIHFLNSAYKLRSANVPGYMTFQKMFEELNGYPLKGSEEMREVLKSVDALNWGELSQIDEKKTFVGPVLDTIAKTLIPVMKFEEGGSEDKKDLLQALRGIYK